MKLFMLFFVQFLIQPSHGQTPDKLALIHDFLFIPGNRLSPQISQIEITGPGEFAAALAAAAKGFETKSGAVRSRASHLLEILKVSSSRLILDLNDENYAAISSDARQILKRFAWHSSENQWIVETFDNLNLWTGDDVWYFAELAKFDRKLVRNGARLLSIIERLSAGEISVLESALRSRRLTAVSLAVLQRLGRATELEVEEMLAAIRAFYSSRINFEPGNPSRILASVNDDPSLLSFFVLIISDLEKNIPFDRWASARPKMGRNQFYADQFFLELLRRDLSAAVLKAVCETRLLRER